MMKITKTMDKSTQKLTIFLTPPKTNLYSTRTTNKTIPTKNLSTTTTTRTQARTPPSTATTHRKTPKPSNTNTSVPNAAKASWKPENWKAILRCTLTSDPSPVLCVIRASNKCPIWNVTNEYTPAKGHLFVPFVTRLTRALTVWRTIWSHIQKSTHVIYAIKCSPNSHS